MTWAFIAARGNTQNKSAASTVTLSPSATVIVGRVLTVFIACNNTGTGDGDLGDIVSVTDNKGNTYTKAIQFTNGQGGAASGATEAIYFSKITTELLTTDTITVTFVADTSAKVVMLEEYSVAVGTTSISVSGSATQAGDNATTVSMAISGLVSQEYLFLASVSVEGPGGDTYTGDADYASPDVTRLGTTGAGAATNMTCNHEGRIATLTGDTYNATLGTARDFAGGFVALKEVRTTTQTIKSEANILNRVTKTVISKTKIKKSGTIDRVVRLTRQPQKQIFRNPRGQQFYYAIVKSNIGNNTDVPLALYKSSDSNDWIWVANLGTGTETEQSITEPDVDLFDDGTQLVVFLTYNGPNDVRYRRLVIPDSASDPTIGAEVIAIESDGASRPMFSPRIKRDRNGNVHIVVQQGIAGAVFNVIVYIAGTTTTTPGDSPTFSTKTALHTYPGDSICPLEAETGVNNFLTFGGAGDIGGIIHSGRAVSACALSLQYWGIDIVSFNGTIYTLGSEVQLTDSNDSIVLASVVDSDNFAHHIYDKGASGLQSKKASSSNTVETWNTAITVSVTNPDGLCLAIDKTPTPDKLYAFYKAPSGTALLSRNSPTDTISWSSSDETIIDDSLTNEFTCFDTDLLSRLHIVYRRSTTNEEKYTFKTLATVTQQTIPSLAIIRASTTKTITSLASIKATSTQTITSLATIRVTTTKTITSQATIRVSTSKTLPSLAGIKATTTKTITSLASILASSTKTIPSLASIRVTQTKTIPSLAVIRASVTKTVPSLAAIKATVTKTIPSLTSILKTATQTITSQAVVKVVTTKTIPSLAVIKGTTTRELASLASIKQTITKTLASQATIRVSIEKTIPSLATIKASSIKTIISQASIRATSVKTIASLSTIRATATKTIPSLATIKVAITKTITSLASIKATSTQLITSLASVRATVTKTLSSQATVKATVTKTITSLASIRFTTTRTIASLASIRVTVTKTLPSLADIRASPTRTIPSLADILATTTKTITSLAQISVTGATTQTIPSQATIKATVTKTIVSLASIRKSAIQLITSQVTIRATQTRTLASLADIKATVSKEVASLATIRATSTKTIISLASIRQTVTQVIGSLSTIKATTTKTISSLASIRTTVTRTLASIATVRSAVIREMRSLASIKASSIKTLTSLASIRATVLQTISSQASIRVTVSRTIVSLADIRATVSRTLPSLASIRRTASRTIPSLAQISIGITVIKTISSLAVITPGGSRIEGLRHQKPEVDKQLARSGIEGTLTHQGTKLIPKVGVFPLYFPIPFITSTRDSRLDKQKPYSP